MARKGGKDRGLKPVVMASGKTWWKARVYRGNREWLSQAVPTKKEARDIYTKVKAETREQEYFPKRHFTRRAASVTVNDLLDLVVADYRRNQRKSPNTALMHQRFWANFAGRTPAQTITGRLLQEWADRWIADGLTTSTVNRRVSMLLRGYRLAQNAEPPLLITAPKWQHLEEPPARSGFIEWREFNLIRNALPDYARIPVSIAFWLGIRWGENRALRLAQVTFDHQKHTVTFVLSGQQTKTKKPRIIVMAGDLYDVLSVWVERTKKLYPWCPYLCHRNGKPIGTVDTILKSVCVRLGLATGLWIKGKGYWTEYVGPLMHDFRRTGTRNLRRANVDRDVCKRITGHSTDSCFTRYNIVNEADLEEAGLRVSQFIMHQTPTNLEPGENRNPATIGTLPAS